MGISKNGVDLLEISRKITRWETKQWLILACALRLIASYTRVNWHYPDEWYQTVEFSRLLMGRSANYTHEMGLHLRNLTWPLMLCIPLKLADWIAPHWTHLRLILAHLLAATLDLAAIWSFARLSKRWSAIWKNLGFALLILPWFQVQDGVSLGIEHVCVCLIWITLACIQAESLFLAGIFALGIFAAKYPAGLVTAGFSVALVIRYRSTPKSILRYVYGLLVGVLIFGVADWIFYGRPWESLWMYLQYNVLTSAATAAFGKQGLSAYFDFFQSRWLHVLLPVGLIFAVTGVAGFFKDLRRAQPWALAFFAYLLGHFLISHREARFMFPAEALLLWGALKYCAENFPAWRPAKWVKVAFLFAFLLNFPSFLKATIAETGTLNSSYFGIDQHLEDTLNVCAVITQREINSLLIPGSDLETGPAYAYFNAIRRLPTFQQARLHALAWYSRTGHCQSNDQVLLLIDQPDVSWVENGCRLQRSGILEILPQSLWLPILRRGWMSGPWYACPAAILSAFTEPVVEQPFIQELPKIAQLPALGTSAQELVEIGKPSSHSVSCKWTCP